VAAVSTNQVASFTCTGPQCCASGAVIKLYENDGTAVLSGSRLGGFLFGGPRTAAGAVSNAAGIFGWAEENWGQANGGACLTFETVAAGTTTRSAKLMLSSAGSLLPGSDNVQPLGGAAQRWSVVYCGTGTINTSGRANKADIRPLSDAEMVAAAALGAKICMYRFRDAIAQKGDGARWHAGMIYEDVVAAFAEQGLDPYRYGVVCRDPAMKTTVVAEDGETHLAFEPDRDEEGAQKWVCGLRYDELMAFVLTGLMARLAAVEVR
jgi:hypothetical protein